MSRSEHIQCDNDNCKSGKYFKQCGNGHDICSLCWIEWKDEPLCPICLENARLIK